METMVREYEIKEERRKVRMNRYERIQYNKWVQKELNKQYMKHSIKCIYLIVNLKRIKGREWNRGRSMRHAKVYIDGITKKTI